MPWFAADGLASDFFPGQFYFFLGGCFGFFWANFDRFDRFGTCFRPVRPVRNLFGTCSTGSGPVRDLFDLFESKNRLILGPGREIFGREKKPSRCQKNADGIDGVPFKW